MLIFVFCVLGCSNCKCAVLGSYFGGSVLGVRCDVYVLGRLSSRAVIGGGGGLNGVLLGEFYCQKKALRV